MDDAAAGLGEKERVRVERAGGVQQGSAGRAHEHTQIR